jgi:hypothetical protein
MSDLSNLFRDFNKPNIINWLREIGTFFRSPRTYVTNLAAKQPEDLLPQFLELLPLPSTGAAINNNGDHQIT